MGLGGCLRGAGCEGTQSAVPTHATRAARARGRVCSGIPELLVHWMGHAAPTCRCTVPMQLTRPCARTHFVPYLAAAVAVIPDTGIL